MLEYVVVYLYGGNVWYVGVVVEGGVNYVELVFDVLDVVLECVDVEL